MSSEESINLPIPEFISKLSTSPFQIIPNGIRFLKIFKQKNHHNIIAYFPILILKIAFLWAFQLWWPIWLYLEKKKNLKILVYEQKAFCGWRGHSSPVGDAPANPLQGREPALKPIRGNSCLHKSWAFGLLWNDSIKLRGTPLCPAAVAKTVMFKGYSD